MIENTTNTAALRDLLNHGKKTGSLTTKEITDVLEELNFDEELIVNTSVEKLKAFIGKK